MNKCEFFKCEDFRTVSRDCGCRGFHGLTIVDAVATANRLLAERATRVYGNTASTKDNEYRRCFGIQRNCDHDTHQALLIAVEPIERDTAESLLREMLSVIEAKMGPNYTDILIRSAVDQGLIERAKRILK